MRRRVPALRITLLNWDEQTAEHIWGKHRVRPQEAEQVVFSPDKFIFLSRDVRYLILGRTEAGRYLLVVVENLYKGACDLVTAREPPGRKDVATSSSSVELRKRRCVTMARIPELKTREEAREFWDTHDLTDYLEDLELVEEEIFIRPKKKQIVSIRMERRLVEILKELAARRGLPYSALVRSWILERLRQELTSDDV